MHAAAGGLGQMLDQIAKNNGVDRVMAYEGFADQVKRFTDGRGASVVYVGVGAATFAALESRKTTGKIVLER